MNEIKYEKARELAAKLSKQHNITLTATDPETLCEALEKSGWHFDEASQTWKKGI